MRVTQEDRRKWRRDVFDQSHPGCGKESVASCPGLTPVGWAKARNASSPPQHGTGPIPAMTVERLVHGLSRRHAPVLCIGVRKHAVLRMAMASTSSRPCNEDVDGRIRFGHDGMNERRTLRRATGVRREGDGFRCRSTHPMACCNLIATAARIMGILGRPV